jgi:surface antigen
MTEREIPDHVGFLFGGKTDSSTFAPLAVSEPEKLMTDDSSTAAQQAPVYRSRREMRAAGGYGTPAIPDLVEPARAPQPALLGDVASIPTALAPITESIVVPIETLATVAASVIIPDAAPVSPVPVSTVPPVPVSTVPPVPEPAATQAISVAELFGFDAADEAFSSTVAPASIPRAAPAAGPAFSFSPAHAPAAEPVAGSRSTAPRSSTPRSSSRRSKRAARDLPARFVPTSRPASVRPNSAGALDRKTIGQRITGLGVMVLIGGLFTVLALPAYADNNASSLTAATKLGSAQKLAVSAAEAAGTNTTVTRDGYTATSASDLKALYSSAVKQQNLSSYLQSGAKAQGDDYPWFAELSRNQGGGLSPLNYYYRECVDFVAWRLNRDAGSTSAPFKWVWSNLTPNGGNASQWKSAWLAHGWATGTTPQVGAVAWFNYNHVAYVSGILNDGSVLVEEYNWEGQHLYGTRVIQPGDAYYLYAPPA